MKRLLFLAGALFLLPVHVVSEPASNALVFIDDPDADLEVTDSVSIFKLDNSSGSPTLEEVDLLDAGHMVTLSRTQESSGDRPKLSVHTFPDVDGEYYEVSVGNNGSQEKLYASKSDIDARGFLTGPRNSKNMLKESLMSSSEGGKVKVFKEAPYDCANNKCKTASIDNNEDLIVMDSQFFKVTGADGKETYKNYLLAKTPSTTDGPFWIEAGETVIREKEASDTEECDDCKNAKDPLREIIEGANDIKDSAEISGMDSIVEQLLPHIGKCFSGEKKGKRIYNGRKDYVSKVIPKLKSSLKIGDRTLNKDEIAAIDVLSRTIYGEMASCNRHGPQYLGAVGRVTLNRVKYIEEEGQQLGAEFGHKSFASVAPPFGEVVLRPNAFSLWNPGDPAGNNAFCPANPKFDDSKQETTSGKRKHYQPAVDAYKKALEVAAKAVLYPDRLKSETKGVRHLFYTSGVSRGKGFVEAKKVTTPSGTIQNPSCVRLWASQPIRQRLKSTEPLKYGFIDLEDL